MLRKYIVYLWIGYLCFLTPALASYISMSTTFSVQEKDGNLTITITSENKGDESAHQVQFKAHVGEHQYISSITPKLNVNEKATAVFTLTNPLKLPGTYPVFVTTYYQDANGYKFSAISVGSFDFQTPVRGDIQIKGEEIKIPANGKNKLHFTIRNNSSQAHQLKLRLHIPDELTLVEELNAVSIDSRAEKTITYVVKNFSALENSSYAVFLVAEYDHDGKHYTSSTSTIVRISATQSIFSISPKYVIPIVAVLIIGFIILQFRRKKTVAG